MKRPNKKDYQTSGSMVNPYGGYDYEKYANELDKYLDYITNQSPAIIIKPGLLKGHKIEHNGKEFVYSDTKQPTISTHKTRPCGHCNEHTTKEGHDNCLGILPGLINACCGHGVESSAYVQFMDESCIRGRDAVNIIEVLKIKRGY